MATAPELDKNFEFLLNILCTATEFKADWKKANVKLGLSRPDVV